VFLAVLPLPHAHLKNAWRSHRLVTLPDYQGIGVGREFCNHVAGVYRANHRRFYATSAHPARVKTLARSPHWRLGRAASMTAARGKTSMMGPGRELRFTSSFEYVGPPVTDSLLLSKT
jgi:GNAT superfamily N-acetyltransferase